MSIDVGRCSGCAGRNYTFPFSPGKVGAPSLDIREKGDKLILNVFHPEVIINGEWHGVMFDDDSTCYTFSYNIYVHRNRSGQVCAPLLSFLDIGTILLFVQVVIINYNEGTLLMHIQ